MVSGAAIPALQEREPSNTRPAHAFPGLPKCICDCRIDLGILQNTSSEIVVSVTVLKTLQKSWRAEDRRRPSGKE